MDVFTRQHAGEDEDGTAKTENVRVIHLEGGPPDVDLKDLLLHVEPFTRSVLEFQKRSGVRYDVVHSHYWLSALAGRRLADSGGARHVATFHTLAKLKRRARAGEDEPGFRSRAEGDIIRSADWITASTPHEAEALVELYDAPRERVKIVHCGVDTSLFRPLDAAESRRRLGLNGEKVALYVGRIEPLKGVEFLLRIAACVDEDVPFKLLIVGGDPASEPEPRRLAELAGQLGLSDVVEFVGRAPRDTLATYFLCCRRLRCALLLRKLWPRGPGGHGLRRASDCHPRGRAALGGEARTQRLSASVALPGAVRRYSVHDLLQPKPSRFSQP